MGWGDIENSEHKRAQESAREREREAREKEKHQPLITPTHHPTTRRALKSNNGMQLFSGTATLLKSFYHFDSSTKVETIELTIPWKIGDKALAKDTSNAFIWAVGSSNTYGE